MNTPCILKVNAATKENRDNMKQNATRLKQ